MTTTIRPKPQSDRHTAVRRKIRWADLAWLTWRQQRGAILVTAALVTTIIAGLLWVNARLPNASCIENSHCFETFYHFQRFGPPLLWAAFGLPFFVATFVAAPLVAREYEQRTNLLAWSQDVSEPRWLLSRAVLLGVISAGLIALTVPAASALLDTMNTNLVSDAFNEPWDSIPFESAVPLAVAYTLCALGIGIAIGALVRRVLPAIGLTLAVFAALRVLLQLFRFRLIPPVASRTPISQLASGGSAGIPEGAHSIGDVTFVDASGRAVDVSRCDSLDCFQSAGVVYHEQHYQPLERLDALRLVEAGIFVAVALVAIALAIYRVQRRRSLS